MYFVVYDESRCQEYMCSSLKWKLGIGNHKERCVKIQLLKVKFQVDIDGF